MALTESQTFLLGGGIAIVSATIPVIVNALSQRGQRDFDKEMAQRTWGHQGRADIYPRLLQMAMSQMNRLLARIPTADRAQPSVGVSIMVSPQEELDIWSKVYGYASEEVKAKLDGFRIVCVHCQAKLANMEAHDDSKLTWDDQQQLETLKRNVQDGFNALRTAVRDELAGPD